MIHKHVITSEFVVREKQQKSKLSEQYGIILMNSALGILMNPTLGILLR